MKKLIALSVLALAAPGCSRGGAVSVVFKGVTQPTSIAKDTRAPSFRCPAKLTWPDEVKCGYCGGTGNCPTCALMKQVDGKCYNCAGSGTLVLGEAAGVPIGETKACPNCKQTGKCATCGKQGAVPQKCDYCQGGKVNMSLLKQKAAAEHKPE
jgi:hypothetical protein